MASNSSTAGPTGRVIRKDRSWNLTPNVVDYEASCAAFSWTAARRQLDGLPSGRGLNIAHEAVDRHADGDAAARVALRFLDGAGRASDLTYGQLKLETSRFANVLGELGVGRSERVFSLTGRVPALYVTALGTLKAGAVFCPLFSAFGPEPIRERLSLGDARVLVTTKSLYRRKLSGIQEALPGLHHILLADAQPSDGTLPDGVLALPELMRRAPDHFEIPPTEPGDMALVHFTSGTTGSPKGAVHVHEAVVAHHATGSMALDLHSDDVFWCTADPGWVTGTSYGIISPLTHGVTSIVDEAEFDVSRWYACLEEQRVSVWYTAPTAVRMLMKAGPEPARTRDLRALRFVASVGEPLNPEAVVWGEEVLGHPIHDNWWQTETGGIMIANLAANDIKPGSMGLPIPGIHAEVALRDESGRAISREGTIAAANQGVVGELALEAGWPSMFRGYLHDEERYRKCFLGPWYLTGDLVSRDGDGYLWFVGRSDDVIKSAGHLIGPFEVESTLMEHPAVVEAGVIGKPDPVVGERVKAFVSLRPGYEPTEKLRLELIGWGRKRLGSAVAPKEIDFDQQLPKTRSGKIMRRLLKARETGAPIGDLSTLEPES